MTIDLKAMADELTPPEGLSDLLARLVERQAKRDEAAAIVKALDKDIETLESQAAEQLAMSGLDGCRVAGKTWWIDEALRLSLTKEKREELLEAAKAHKLDDAVTLNPASLKAWLKERAEKQGCPIDEAVKGTQFDGLIGQYVEIRLRSRTMG